MLKLKPCPFCGAPATQKTSPQPRAHGWVGCPACGCYIQWAHDPAGAVAKWNRRAGAKPYHLLHEEGGWNLQ